MNGYILEVAIPARLWQRFDYLPPPGSEGVQDWPAGIRIQAPFGRRTLIGVLLAVKSTSNVAIDKLKPVVKKLDDQPVLTPTILSLCRWASDYYHHPLGEVVIQALPKILRQHRECPVIDEINGQSEWIQAVSQPLTLNADQQRAVQAINAEQGFQTFLLDGITGSGKTEVYFQTISALLAAKKQVLVLVPEIALTPQTVARFEQRFNAPIALLHSDLSDKKRLTAWLHAKQGLAAIVIGTRSAIFTPLLNPGMIILDEEHDLSFKQQNNLRYSARDLAIVRAQLENIPIILGSATPSLESLYNAITHKFTHLSLPQRAGEAKSPAVNLINLRGKRLVGGLSKPLLDEMQQHLADNGQVLLFLNRRGYAPVLMCHHCGWMAKCTRCDARLTLHFQPERLHCHHCGMIKHPPKKCEGCRYPELITAGQGTERIEQVMAEYFPEYSCVRIDRDSTQRRGSIEKLLAEAHQQKAQILIGTQMLAKGHHFPQLTLVAIVDADSGLFSVDFRALERIAQLLVQVAGRAGRSERAGEVIIQTHHPDHPHLQCLLKFGYQRFARAILTERQQALLPPFAHLALLRAEANQRELTHEFLTHAKSSLENLSPKNINLLGPTPAPMERCAGRFRGQLLLQAIKRSELQEILRVWVPTINCAKIAKKVRWSLDVDPQELI